MENQLNIIILQGKLKDFLVGNFKPINSRYADIPTDTDSVFDILKSYYIKTNSPRIWQEFENSINSIIDDKDFIFLVPLYLYSFLRFKQKYNAINIDINKIKTNLKNGIEKFEDYLRDNPNWIGKNIDGGLLAYIYYIATLIKEEFNVDLGLEDSKP